MLLTSTPTITRFWLLPDVLYIGSFFLLPYLPWLVYWILPCFCLSLANCWRCLQRNEVSAVWLLCSLLLPWYGLVLWQKQPVSAAPDDIPQNRWPFRLTALLMILALAALLFTSTVQQKILNPALAPLDSAAHQVLKKSLLLTSGSFATARLIDRGIAFVSEAEVSVGVASIKPGQFLKPLQDMAVRYSDLMVLAMASVGIQLFLLEFARVAALPLFGSAVLLVVFCYLFTPSYWHKRLKFLLKLSVTLLLLIRIGLPLAAFAVDGLSQWLLAPQRIAAETRLTEVTAPLEQIQTRATTDTGVFGWLKKTADQASDIAASVRLFSDSMVEQLVQLVVVYALQTLIFPLLSLWLLYWTGRWLLHNTPD